MSANFDGRACGLCINRLESTLGARDLYLSLARDLIREDGLDLRDGIVQLNGAFSLCLIVRNEELHLPWCLQSVADLVDEKIVVDCGSTDRTREIASGFGARVIDFAWCDDFAAARNESLRHTTGDWIFYLDGDEHLDSENRQRLRSLFERLDEEKAGYVLTQRSPMPMNSSVALVKQVRLFPYLPGLRWQYRVHEQIAPALEAAGAKIKPTDIVIEHAGYQSLEAVRHKQRRNLRLLQLDHAEHPDDFFILFHLGWTCLATGRTPAALRLLRRSLQRCPDDAVLVPKLHELIARAYLQLGRLEQALAGCRAGLRSFPDDVDLLYLEGALLAQRGDLRAAEACFQRLLDLKNLPAFAQGMEGLTGSWSMPLVFDGTEEGLCSYQARHQLALVYRRQGRDIEAAAQWQAALAERPEWAPAWLELAKLYHGHARWQELDLALKRLWGLPGMALEAGVLQARAHLARQEFTEARQLLEQVIAQAPSAVIPRIFLAHVLLQEGKDVDAAERALRAVLDLTPMHAESWANLAKLYRNQNRIIEALAACESALEHCPNDADLLLLQGAMLREMGDLVGAENSLQQVLEREIACPAANGHAHKRHRAAQYQLARLYQERGFGTAGNTKAKN